GDGPLPRGADAVPDRGRHQAPAGGERRPNRPRDGALRHRPRGPPPGLPGAGTAGAARAPVDRRRRCARLGAGPQRSLQRGAPLLATRPPPRHEGQREAVPPRRDRALPRPRRAPVGAPCARSEPAVLPALVTRSEEARPMRASRRILLLATLGLLAFPAVASAHPLGNFTINR